MFGYLDPLGSFSFPSQRVAPAESNLLPTRLPIRVYAGSIQAGVNFTKDRRRPAHPANKNTNKNKLQPLKMRGPAGSACGKAVGGSTFMFDACCFACCSIFVGPDRWRATATLVSLTV